MADNTPRYLVHYSLCPFSRFVRLILQEKQIDITLVEKKPWQFDESFRKLSPVGALPVLVEKDGHSIVRGGLAIAEYLEESYDLPCRLLPAISVDRACVREIVGLFASDFYHQVTAPILQERVIKRLSHSGHPDSARLRQAVGRLKEYLIWMGEQLDHDSLLSGGNYMTLADLMAVGHLSIIDFVGDLPWFSDTLQKDIKPVHAWYARMKSRRSYRTLLEDCVQGIQPPKHYENPDF